MNEERNKDKEVDRLKEELRELIDHKIKHNNGFTNLLRGDYSLFIFLIASILSVYSARELGFLTQHYVLSVYLVFGIWSLYAIIGAGRAQREQEDAIELITKHQEILRVIIDWHFKWARGRFYSLWMLFILCIVVLWFSEDIGWWQWVPAIVFTVIIPPIAEKGAVLSAALLDTVRSTLRKKERELDTLRKKVPATQTIIYILILAVIVIYLGYITHEYEPYSLLEVILTMVLILISLATLSEYLSMKFMVNEVSNQNHKLSILRMGIDRIEGTEALEKKKKELLKWWLPKADPFLCFFNYYGLMVTEYTLEEGEKEELLNKNTKIVK